MSLFPVKFKQDSVNGGAYNYRQKAATLWRDSLESGYGVTYDSGFVYRTDFMGFPAAASLAAAQAGGMSWLKTDIGAATGSAVLTSNKQFGNVKLSTTAAGTGIGTQVLFAGLLPSGFVSKTNNRLIFECSLDLSSSLLGSTTAGATITAPCFFAGLTTSATGAETVFTTATLAIPTTRSLIGFSRVSSNTVTGGLVFTSQFAGSTAYTQTILTAAQMATLAATSTKLNLGLALNGVNPAGTRTVDIVVNGEYYASTTIPVNATQMPAVAVDGPSVSAVSGDVLVPVIAVADTTTAGTVAALSLEVDWLEVNQTS